MQALARILLQMQARDADLARAAVRQIDDDHALADDRLQVLRDLIAGGQIGIEVVLPVEHRALVDLGVEAEARLHRLLDAEALMTGSMPGKAASTKLTWVLGSAPNSVAAPENSLALEMTWAWTSRPSTISQAAVAAFDVVVPLRSCSSRRLCREARRLLEHLGGAEQRRLVEGLADELQAERQAVFREARRHRDARQAGEIHRHGEDVVQVHGDGIVHLLADGEGRRRRRGRQDRRRPS